MHPVPAEQGRTAPNLGGPQQPQVSSSAAPSDRSREDEFAMAEISHISISDDEDEAVAVAEDGILAEALSNADASTTSSCPQRKPIVLFVTRL